MSSLDDLEDFYDFYDDADPCYSKGCSGYFEENKEGLSVCKRCGLVKGKAPDPDWFNFRIKVDQKKRKK